MSFTYDVESIRKIEEARDNFESVTKPIEEALANLLEVAEDAGMPALIQSVEAVQANYESGFKKANAELVEICNADIKLWRSLGETMGAL